MKRIRIFAAWNRIYFKIARIGFHDISIKMENDIKVTRGRIPYIPSKEIYLSFEESSNIVRANINIMGSRKLLSMRFVKPRKLWKFIKKLLKSSNTHYNNIR